MATRYYSHGTFEDPRKIAPLHTPEPEEYELEQQALTLQILQGLDVPTSATSPLSCITDRSAFSFAESIFCKTDSFASTISDGNKSFSDLPDDDDDDFSDSESYYEDIGLQEVATLTSTNQRRFTSYQDCVAEGLSRFLSIKEPNAPQASRSCIELNSQLDDSCKEVFLPVPTLMSCRVESVGMLDFPEFIPDESPVEKDPPADSMIQHAWAELLNPPPIDEIHPALRPQTAQDPMTISRETMRQEWTEWPPVKLADLDLLVIPPPQSQKDGLYIRHNSMPPPESPPLVRTTRSKSSLSGVKQTKREKAPRIGKFKFWQSKT